MHTGIVSSHYVALLSADAHLANIETRQLTLIFLDLHVRQPFLDFLWERFVRTRKAGAIWHSVELVVDTSSSQDLQFLLLTPCTLSYGWPEADCFDKFNLRFLGDKHVASTGCLRS